MKFPPFCLPLNYPSSSKMRAADSANKCKHASHRDTLEAEQEVQELSERLASAIANPPPAGCVEVKEVADPEAEKLPFLLQQLKNEVQREVECMQQDFKLQAELQLKENARFRTLLADIKMETDTIHSQMLAAKKQLEKLEEEIGTG
ncbi:hypothetical protein Efla_003026 [Eimeria flavescens]